MSGQKDGKSLIFQKLEQCDLCLPWIVINPQLKRKLLANHPCVCLKVGGNTWIVRYRAIFGTPKLENQDSYCLNIAGRGRPYQCICFTSSIFYVKANHHVILQFFPVQTQLFLSPPWLFALFSTNPINCAFAAKGIASSLSWIFHTCWLKIIWIPAICRVIHSRTSLQSSNIKRMVECLICFQWATSWHPGHPGFEHFQRLEIQGGKQHAIRKTYLAMCVVCSLLALM